MKNILIMTPEEISQLSDEDLTALCTIYFPVTRPSKVALNKAAVNAVLKKSGLDPKKFFKAQTKKAVTPEEKERESYIKKYGEEAGKVVYEELVKARNNIKKDKK